LQPIFVFSAEFKNSELKQFCFLPPLERTLVLKKETEKFAYPQRARDVQRLEGSRFMTKQLCNIAASDSRGRPQNNAGLSGTVIALT